MPKITNVRIIEMYGKPHELIIDFDNDRHHAMKVEAGENRHEFVERLIDFIGQLISDKLLDDHEDQDKCQ